MQISMQFSKEIGYLFLIHMYTNICCYFFLILKKIITEIVEPCSEEYSCI